MFTYRELLNHMKRGLRNGSWFKLSKLQRALYKAALLYAKHRGKITSRELIAQLHSIIEKLFTPGLRILRRGLERAERLVEAYKRGYLSWCPELLQWLTDPNYIFHLGL